MRFRIVLLSISAALTSGCSRLQDASDAKRSSQESSNDNRSDPARPVSQSLVFLNPSVDLGITRQTTRHAFEFENQGPGAVRIKSVTPTCQCTVTKPDREIFQPGEHGFITVDIDPTRTSFGRHTYAVDVQYEDSETRQTRVRLSIQNCPDIQVIPGIPRLRCYGDLTARTAFRLVDHRELPLTITEIECSSAALKARITEVPQTDASSATYLIEVTFCDPNRPPGDYTEIIHLRTNDPTYQALEVKLEITKHQRIQVAPTNVSLRLEELKLGGSPLAKVFLRDVEGEQIVISSIECSPERVLHCAFNEEPAHFQVVTIRPGNESVKPEMFPVQLHIKVIQPCKQDILVTVTGSSLERPSRSHQ